MLKGIDRSLSAEMLYVLMLMGHGDDLVVCDVNHPAAAIAKETVYGKLIDMRPRSRRAVTVTAIRGLRSAVDAFGDPQLHQGLPGHAEPRRLAVERRDDPTGKIDIDTLDGEVGPARARPVEVRAHVLAVVEGLIECLGFHNARSPDPAPGARK